MNKLFLVDVILPNSIKGKHIGNKKPLFFISEICNTDREVGIISIGFVEFIVAENQDIANKILYEIRESLDSSEMMISVRKTDIREYKLKELL